MFAAGIVAAPAAHAVPEASVTVAETAIVVAQAGSPEEGRLSPRYEPAPVQEPCWYNSSYLFGMTRGLAESTIHPAGKAPLFVLTVPLDILFLPFTAIGGLFG